MKMTHDNCLTFKMQNNVSVNPLDNRSTEVVTSSVVYLALLCRRLAPCIYCAPPAGCLALLVLPCYHQFGGLSICIVYLLESAQVYPSASPRSNTSSILSLKVKQFAIIKNCLIYLVVPSRKSSLNQ
jgi:acyl-CoA synthetase (AMP-forming)/AMP-acid ligase II